MRQAAEVAGEDRQTIRLGQAVDLGVDRRAEVEAVGLGLGPAFTCWIFGLAIPTPRRLVLRPAGDPARDRVEPASEKVAAAEGLGLADEHEERGLERVVDVVGVAEHGPADRKDHGAVPGDDRLEGRAVAAGDEAVEELALAQAGDGPGPEQAADLVARDRELTAGHGVRPPA